MKEFYNKSTDRTQYVGEGYNGWVFLFGCFWYLFKGMFAMALITFVFALIINYLLGLWGIVILWILMGFFANRQYEDYLVSKGYTISKEKEESDWECDYCGKLFKTKAGTEKHEKTCKKSKHKQKH